MAPNAGELPFSRFKRTKFHAQPADGRVGHSGPVYSSLVMCRFADRARKRRDVDEGHGRLGIPP